MIRMEITDAGSQQLAALADAIPDAVDAAVRKVTAMTLTRVRANASSAYQSSRGYRGHRSGTGPGPNVVTGDYRRSIAMEATRTREGATGFVFSNAVQARRLEYGFRGADALGRRYNQPPYPHFKPAADLAEKDLPKELRDKIGKLVQARGGEGNADG